MTNPIDDALGSLRRHATPDRDKATAVPGLTLFHLSAPSPTLRMFYQPSIAIVLQGEKTVTVGREERPLAPGQFLLASVAVPTYARVSQADAQKPYLACTLDLDLPLVRDVAEGQAPNPVFEGGIGLAIGDGGPDLVALFGRFLGLLDRPTEVPFMAELLHRELIHRLLVRPEGAHLAQMARVDSRTARLMRVLDHLNTHYARPFDMPTLASLAGMGVSTLHHHFRALTSISPLQYQKSLRLEAARRAMLEEGLDATSAAFRVGYESTTQFSREYARHFGQPPLRDTRQHIGK